MNRSNAYRAKAFELLSLAESVNDPEPRADMLRLSFIGADAQSAVRLRVSPGESRLNTVRDCRRIDQL
jgi:hypothetical protein